jgi:hypothetical protein
MLFLIAAASLALQDAPVPDLPDAAPQEIAQDELEQDTVQLEGAAPILPPAPITDAPTLIAQFDTAYAAHGDIIAQMAGRKARERYLRSLLIPIISRSDLDAGARSAIMTETRDTFDAVAAGNTAWAVGRLDPDIFTPLYEAQPRLALEILGWAERDETAALRVLAILGPVALAGDYDASIYASRIDAQAVAENRAQIYGTEFQCADGEQVQWPVDAPERLEERRAALDLVTMEEFAAQRLADGVDTCAVPEEEDGDTTEE